MARELSHKADMALADLTSNGGILSPEQNDTFIRDLLDAPTMLRSVRQFPMDTPEARINKIGFGSRILFAAPQGTPPYAADDGSNDRWLAAADRSAVTTAQVVLTTKEVMAEIRIPYEVLEDNIERGGLEGTILSMIAERAALDLEEWVILADDSSGDPYLALENGVLKRTTSHVVDALSATVSAEIFNNMKKALPTKYRRNLNTMRFMVSMDRESDYRLKVSGRETGLGDSILTGNQVLPVLGIGMTPVALLPDVNALLLNPQNVIFGIQRNLRIEQDREIRSREIIIVLTARVGIAIEEEDAMVKLINLG